MNRRTLLPLLLAAPMVGAVFGPCRAAGEPSTTAAFIQALGHDLQATMQGATSDAEKRQRLKPFLQRVVAVDAVAQFCLGRYWRRATPAQQQEYKALYIDALAAAVASRAGTYAADTNVTVQRERATPDGAAVPTLIRTGNQPPVHITWVVDTSATPLRILDVVAEGISLRLSLRNDYQSFLDRHGGDMDAFLAALRAHTGA